MKKLLIVLSFFLLTATYSQGTDKQNAPGFRDIPFSTPYREVFKALKAQKKDMSKGSLIPNIRDYAYPKYISIDDFPLGDHKATVLLFFDTDENFYSFLFAMDRYPANKIKTKVFEQAEFLTDIFSQKYGAATQCFDQPSFFEIKEGHTRFRCKWEKDDFEAYTGYSTSDNYYNALGVVSLKSLKLKQEAEKEQEKIKATKEGAKSF